MPEIPYRPAIISFIDPGFDQALVDALKVDSSLSFDRDIRARADGIERIIEMVSRHIEQVTLDRPLWVVTDMETSSVLGPFLSREAALSFAATIEVSERNVYLLAGRTLVLTP